MSRRSPSKNGQTGGPNLHHMGAPRSNQGEVEWFWSFTKVGGEEDRKQNTRRRTSKTSKKANTYGTQTQHFIKISFWVVSRFNNGSKYRPGSNMGYGHPGQPEQPGTSHWWRQSEGLKSLEKDNQFAPTCSLEGWPPENMGCYTDRWENPNVKYVTTMMDTLLKLRSVSRHFPIFRL